MLYMFYGGHIKIAKSDVAFGDRIKENNYSCCPGQSALTGFLNHRENNAQTIRKRRYRNPMELRSMPTCQSMQIRKPGNL